MNEKLIIYHGQNLDVRVDDEEKDDKVGTVSHEWI